MTTAVARVHRDCARVVGFDRVYARAFEATAAGATLVHSPTRLRQTRCA